MEQVPTLETDFKPKEECGIYGIYGCQEAAYYVYLGLYALQHRGQESAGIVSTNGKKLYRYANMGQVAQVFNQKKLRELHGRAAIGHNRYSTSGASFLRNAQPIRAESRLGSFALAHNGNILNYRQLRRKLEAQGAIFQTTVDSEVIVHLMSRSTTDNFHEALCIALRQVHGAYSLLILTSKTLYAVRDPNGFRPLVLGRRKDNSHVLASETCAFDITEAEYIRDIAPGELVRLDEQGINSSTPFEKRRESLCIFENIYFARPDSHIFGTSVYKMRKNLGHYLARECPAQADAVVPVPDSSNVAALGYAEESGIPYMLGLIRSHYVGRTFIEPTQSIRDFGAKIKYNVVRSVVKGRRIVLVDDSIVRGTTAHKLCKLLREAGAKEIHLRISAPPSKHPCFYGIDIPTSKELIASHYSVEEIAKYLSVDSLGYLSLEMARAAMQNGHPRSWCTACFSGTYPLPVEEAEEGSQKELFPEYRIEEIS